eukprot:TRINITY_DN25183_c0_g1_i1.p1 TRINITY_DN25183_c0_g1~~TRINITY_DN25183_c0_g1_i1.p1  ORF type:complete len:1102 (+),score=361.96 TRINITY_DN25183_c0_g1_i1:35-3307(+)
MPPKRGGRAANPKLKDAVAAAVEPRRPSQVLRTLALKYAKEVAAASGPRDPLTTPGMEPGLDRSMSMVSGPRQTAVRRVSIVPSVDDMPQTPRQRMSQSRRGSRGLPSGRLLFPRHGDENDSNGSDPACDVTESLGRLGGTGIRDRPRRGSASARRRSTRVVVPLQLIGSRLLNNVDLDGDPRTVREHVEAALDEEDELADPVGDLCSIIEAARDKLNEDPDLLNPYHDPPHDVKHRKFYDTLHRNHSLNGLLHRASRLTGRLSRSMELKSSLQARAEEEAKAVKEKCAGMETELKEAKETAEAAQERVRERDEKLQRLLDAWQTQRKDDQAEWEEKLEKVELEHQERLREADLEREAAVEQAWRDCAASIDKGNLMNQIEELKCQLAGTLDTLGEEKAAKNDLRRALNAAEMDIQQLQSASEAADMNLQALRADLTVSQEENAKLEAARSDDQEAQAKLASDQEAERAWREAIESEVEGFKSRVKELESENTSLFMRSQELEAENHNIDNKLAEAQAALSQAEVEISRVRAEVDAHGIQAVKNEMEKELEFVRAQAERDEARRKAEQYQMTSEVFAANNERASLRASMFKWVRFSLRRRMNRQLEAANLRLIEVEQAGRNRDMREYEAQIQEERKKRREEAAVAAKKFRELRDALTSAARRQADQDKELREARARLEALGAGKLDVMASLLDKELDRLAADLIKALGSFIGHFRRRLRVRGFSVQQLIKTTPAPTTTSVPAPIRTMRVATYALQRMVKLLEVDQSLVAFRQNLTGFTIGNRIDHRRVERKLAVQEVPDRLRDFFKRQKDAIEGRHVRVERCKAEVRDTRRRLFDEATSEVGSIEEIQSSVVNRVIESSKEVLRQIREQQKESSVSVTKCVLEQFEEGQWDDDLVRKWVVRTERRQRPSKRTKPAAAKKKAAVAQCQSPLPRYMSPPQSPLDKVAEAAAERILAGDPLRHLDVLSAISGLSPAKPPPPPSPPPPPTQPWSAMQSSTAAIGRPRVRVMKRRGCAQSDVVEAAQNQANPWPSPISLGQPNVPFRAFHLGDYSASNGPAAEAAPLSILLKPKGASRRARAEETVALLHGQSCP